MAGGAAGTPSAVVGTTPSDTVAGKARASSDPRSVPVLEPASGGAAEHVAEAIGADRPVRVFVTIVLAGFALIAGLTIAVGLFLTHVLVPDRGFEKWDNDVNRWFAEHRDPTQEDLSWIGSTVAGGLVIPVLVGALLVVFLLKRKWLLAAFTLFVISIESGVYRATTLVVHRDRPPVDRLESLPVDASFPSGHTAASIALFGGLLLLLASWVRRTWFTVLAAGLALAIALFVSWARTYRGMHHVTDIAAGAVMGMTVLALLVFASRAATAAANRRDAISTEVDR